MAYVVRLNDGQFRCRQLLASAMARMLGALVAAMVGCGVSLGRWMGEGCGSGGRGGLWMAMGGML
ncbi:hypothetical protein FB475_6149 [Kribbella jejuensis]|uniref:Uncharacterized protein n=1 Tax=Kribbella jejuensis TaxID=236068 RepID=A0A542DU14_9ACTN|nr:hypothetical protein FB475_6149 [Kribbella jejuensis]